MEHKDNLLGVLKTLFKWKKQIITICIIAAVGSVVISLFLDNYYLSYTTFYAASPDQALPEPVGIEAGERDYYGESEDMDRILTIAESNEVANYLITKFKLYEHYDIDSTHKFAPFNVSKVFRSHYNVKKTKYDAIEISVEDKEPEMAAAMTNAAREKVSEIAQGIIKSGQDIKINTLRNTIDDKVKYITTLNDSMQIVRKQYGVYNTLTQSEGLSKQISQVESRRARESARRGILQDKKKAIWRDTIAMIDAMVSGMDQQLLKLNSMLDQFNQGVGQVELLEQLHEEASEQMSLDQERLKQLEAKRNSYINTIFLVEKGEVPLRKFRPKRSIICVAAVVIAFMLSIILILIMDVYKDVNWREIVYAK